MHSQMKDLKEGIDYVMFKSTLKYTFTKYSKSLNFTIDNLVTIIFCMNIASYRSNILDTFEIMTR